MSYTMRVFTYAGPADIEMDDITVDTKEIAKLPAFDPKTISFSFLPEHDVGVNVVCIDEDNNEKTISTQSMRNYYFGQPLTMDTYEALCDKKDPDHGDLYHYHMNTLGNLYAQNQNCVDLVLTTADQNIQFLGEMDIVLNNTEDRRVIWPVPLVN